MNPIRAYRRVRSNQGKPGVDGMNVHDLADWLRSNHKALTASLLDGTYQPQPVRGVQIPKPGGGQRQLGIPAVVDRWVRVNHDISMSRVARRIGDERLLRIIRRFLQAGLMQDGVCVARDEGTPQGGPISPLLRSLAAGQRVMESVVRFLEEKLRLRVNRDKSAFAPVGEPKFLRPSAALERQAWDRFQEHPPCEGENPADHPSQPGR
ncbi:MAG: hypothetical protein ABSG03_28680 [Bryobacteraceae bacterium]